jgi:hypothetical protein
MATERGEYIYRPFVTTRSGKRIYARNYGLRAFRIRIRAK